MPTTRFVASSHDHNIVPGAQSALNIRAHKERLPFASWETRLVAGMSGWDLTSSEPRSAARARTQAARAEAIRRGNVTIIGR